MFAKIQNTQMWCKNTVRVLTLGTVVRASTIPWCNQWDFNLENDLFQFDPFKFHYWKYFQNTSAFNKYFIMAKYSKKKTNFLNLRYNPSHLRRIHSSSLFFSFAFLRTIIDSVVRGFSASLPSFSCRFEAGHLFERMWSVHRR